MASVLAPDLNTNGGSTSVSLGGALRFAYGLIAFSTSLLHNVFLLYHVQAFIEIYHIDKTAFWLCELAFLAWNSFNDPLFGWLSDARLLRAAGRAPSSLVTTLVRRTELLMWAGPGLALTFMLFWFRWSLAPVGLQFFVCLLLYDTFLTLIDLHHSALLAELTLESTERANLSTASAAGSALGATSVFVSYLTWSGAADAAAFQRLCLAIAFTSLCGYSVATRVLRSHILRDSGRWKGGAVEEKRIATEASSGAAVLTFARELLGQKNFLWFSFMHLLQVFHCHFNSNFFPLFLQTLLARSVSSTFASILLGMSFALPHLNNFYFLDACKRFGAYSVIRALFVVKLALSAFIFFVGSEHTTLLCIFIASNRIFTEGTCKLLTLVISDLVDEDTVLNERPQPLSALIYGSAALVAKPGQTLAPLLGTMLISFHTGREVFRPATEPRQDFTVDAVSDTLRVACFYMLTLVSASCAVLQLFAWSRYTLRDQRLLWIKRLRAESASLFRTLQAVV